jgi:hypothetical protein
VRDGRKELIQAINGGLKKYASVRPHPSSTTLWEFILDTIEPYKAGNYSVWALHDLDVSDKHQFIIPVLQLMCFSDIRLEDDEHLVLEPGRDYFMDSSCSVSIQGMGNFTLKDKGHAATNILFPIDVPFEGNPVIPSLLQLSQDVSGLIRAFGKFVGKNF